MGLKNAKRHVRRSMRKSLEIDERSELEIDEDYKRYLTYLAECSDSDQHSGLTEQIDDDIPDPQYEMFLKNLRVDGKSYVLKIPTISGFLKYEPSDGSGDSCDIQTKRKLRGTIDGEHIQAEVLRNNSGECEEENSKDLLSEPLNSVDHGKNEFSNARIRPLVSGPQSTCNIEEGPDVDCNQVMQKIISNIIGEKNEAPKDLRNNASSDKVETPKVLRSSKVKETKTLMADISSSPEHVRYDFGKKHKSPILEHDSETFDKVDEDYEIYLKGLRHDDDGQYGVFESGERINLEDSNSDSDMLMTDCDPFQAEGKDTPFVSSRVYASMEGDECQDPCNSSDTGHSQFRVKVISILRRPYDEEEFDELWEDVNARKPVEGSVELRGRTKFFRSERLGKSYLDHYADLKMKIDAYRDDKDKLLNILRGFFYWIKNLSQQGAFRPWLEESCLAIMPGSH